MKDTFNLTQLYRSPEPELIMGTCIVANNPDDRFECTIKGDSNLKKQLWQFVTGKWDGLMAEVEFDDVHNNGIPKSGVILSIKGFTPF